MKTERCDVLVVGGGPAGATLATVLDLERVTSRVTLGIATPRDLLALRQTLEKVPELRKLLASSATAGDARLSDIREQLDELADVRETIARGISDEPPAVIGEPGVIRRGFHAELDELHAITKDARTIIAAMEERERKRTGIGSLKIRYNGVFGFYIEISKANLDRAPADYERKQTLVNAERFTSAELKEHEQKVLSADERILEIERRLYSEIRESIAREAARLRRTAAAIAQLVEQHGAQPAAEFATPIGLKSGQTLHQGDEHLLHQIGRVGFGQALAAGPVVKQRGVEFGKAIPGCLLLRFLELLQKARRRGVHASFV